VPTKLSTTAEQFSSPDFPWEYKVAMGLVDGCEGVHQSGLNADVDALEDVWSQGGLWVPVTQARTISFVSADAEDDGEGTPLTYLEISETITLNGVAAVVTANSYLRVNRVYVATAGSVGTNNGAITGTATTDATVQVHIPAGVGQTQTTIYTCPANKYGIVLGWHASIGVGSGGVTASCRLMNRAFGGAWRARDLAVMLDAATSYFNHEFHADAVYIGPKMDLKIQCNPIAGTNIEVQGDIEVLLVERDS
jgi:hypothetical protein